MGKKKRRKAFLAAVARANRANDEILQGRAAALGELYSHAADASLFGGFGGHQRGWDQIGPRLDWVARSFVGGRCEYQEIASDAGEEIGFVVQLERGEVRISGREEPLRLDLRVTMVFRREDGEWRLLHRHADHLVERESP